MMKEFYPKVMAFCCDQSGYPAFDMAGDLKLKLPENVEIIRVPCAGRIEPIYLLRALENGADGVIVFACYEENCQFLQGNFRLKGRLSYVHRMLERIGLEKVRIEICHLATNQGFKFAEVLWKKINALKRLGPNPWKI